MTLRVAFVLSALQAGGAEGIVAQLSEAAVRRGWDATIVTFDSAGDPVYHPLDPRVRLERLGLPASGGAFTPLRIVQRVAALRRRLRSGNYDVTVSFLTKINTITLLAGLGLRRPIIVSERNNAARQNAHWLWNGLLRLLYPGAAAIVMQTEGSQARLGVRARKRSVVIPNPVRRPAIVPDPTAPPTIAAVGRLTHQKGFDLLISAFAKISDRFPDWRLILWGEGPDRAMLERQVRSLGLAGRIALPGTSDVPGGWLRSSTLFVLSSRYEGWPNVLGEAMAAGLPAIAFKCDFGPEDIIAHKINGILVDAENVEALAAAMSRLIEQPDLRSNFGVLARQSMSRFEASVILNRWLHLIEMCDMRQGPETWKTGGAARIFEAGANRHCP